MPENKANERMNTTADPTAATPRIAGSWFIVSRTPNPVEPTNSE